MHYFNGDDIHIGDCIWWDGGIGIGYVMKILSTESEFTGDGLDEPSILVSLSDNFDYGAPFVAYSQKGIVEDGIEPLKPDEIRVKQVVLSLVAEWLGCVSLICAGIGCEFVKSVRTRWIVVDYTSNDYQCFEVSTSLDQVGRLGSDQVSFLYKPLN